MPESRTRATPHLVNSLPDHDDAALQEWRRWRAATTQAERSKHVTRLWGLCTPVILAALRNLAEELSGQLGRHVDDSDWLQRYNLEKEAAFSAAWQGVVRAAENFDANKGTKFQTYAFPYVKRAIRDQKRGAWAWESKEDETKNELDTKGRLDDTTDEELECVELLAYLKGVPAEQLVERIYQTTRDASEFCAAELEDTRAWFEENISPEQRGKNTALDAVRSILIAQHIRAVDREGGMVRVSDLAQMLRARERGEARKGRNPYSPHALSNQFPYSDKTIKRWLNLCEELGITADNRDPEQLARIMTPRRGPTAG